MTSRKRRSFFGRTRAARTTRSFRPLLETLEERRVLAATLFVNTTADDASGHVSDEFLSLREAIMIANRDLAIADLSDDEEAQIIGSVDTPGPTDIRFALDPEEDANRFYYQNNFAAGVDPGNILATSIEDDFDINDIDPDWNHTWFSIQLAAELPAITHQVIIDGTTQPNCFPNTAGDLQGLTTINRVEIDGSNVTGFGLRLASGVDSDAGGSTIKGLILNNFDGDAIQIETTGGGNSISNCFIGTDVSGTLAKSNLGNGIWMSSEVKTVIGGSAPADRMLISSNVLAGVHSVSGNGNKIEGVLFNTDRSATTGFLTGQPAIYLTNDPSAVLAASAFEAEVPNASFTMRIHNVKSYTTVDMAPTSVIVIDRNEDLPDPLHVAVGVVLYLVAETDPPAPSVLGIDHNNDGVTPNEEGDSDEGPSNLQNFPELTSATSIGGTTKIKGTLNSAPNARYRIRFFSNSLGEDVRAGQRHHGSMVVETDALGNASFTFVSGSNLIDKFVTATATLLDGDDWVKTSEFALGLLVTESPRSTIASDILVLGSEIGGDSHTRVKLIDLRNDNFVLANFAPYGSNFFGGARVAIADLTGDGNAEIITAPGPGRAGLVKVFDLNGVELQDFRINSYPESFQGGVYVAAGDVNGDGRTDIITTPGEGRAAEVKVWKNRVGIASDNPDPIANNPLRQFLAFGSDFKGGASVAAGDLTGDGRAEVVVGNGAGMGNRVRAFDLTTFSTTGLAPRLLEIRPFSESNRGGVFVAVGNLRGSETPEIIVGSGEDSTGRAQLFNADGSRFKTIKAYDDTDLHANVYVAAKDIDGNFIDGNDEEFLEVVTGRGFSGNHHLRTWQPDGELIDDLLVDDPEFFRGFYVA
jgi:hypothetical protein